MTEKNFNFTSNLDDEQWKEFRTWMIGHMKMGPMTVTFTKKDGTERVMKCTLQPDLLPKQEVTEGKVARRENTDTLRVFDLEKQEWRSFTVKSIKQVQFDL